MPFNRDAQKREQRANRHTVLRLPVKAVTIGQAVQDAPDRLFPRVFFAGCLLLNRCLPFQIGRQVPRFTGPEGCDCLSEKLFPICGKRLCLDLRAAGHGPEAPPAAGIPKEGGFIRGARKDALARHNVSPARLGGADFIGCPSQEGFQIFRLCLARRGEFGQFHQPMPAKV